MDTAELERLTAIPDMMRFIGAGGVWPRERVEQVIAFQVRHWEEHGFGWHAALERYGGACVGYMGLNFVGEGTEGLDPKEYEIGWWVAPEHWGKGYAREGAQAVRDYGFNDLSAPSLVARIRPENAASIRVAAAIGMSHELDTTGSAGEPCSVYRLDRV